MCGFLGFTWLLLLRDQPEHFPAAVFLFFKYRHAPHLKEDRITFIQGYPLLFEQPNLKSVITIHKTLCPFIFNAFNGIVINDILE